MATAPNNTKWYPGSPAVNWEELKGCSDCPRHDAEGAFDSQDGIMKIRCLGNRGQGLTPVAESEESCSYRNAGLHEQNNLYFR